MHSIQQRACTSAGGLLGTGARRPLLLIAAIVLAIAAGASPAGAQIVAGQATDQKFGIVPAIGAKPVTTACLVRTGDCTALSYHGGAVMHAERFYQFFWTPAGHAVPAAYKSGLNTFMNATAAYNHTPSTMYSVDQQFYDLAGGTKHFVPYALVNGGQLVDTSPYPANGCTDGAMNVCLNESQLATELGKYTAAHKLPVGPGVEYFIFTPSGVGSCFSSSSPSTECAYTGYCGWHTYMGSAGSSTETLFSDMPWAAGISGCDTNNAFGTGYPNGAASGIDPVVGVWSHEASETMTDPNLNAWYESATGAENGDKCAYVYGSGGYGSMAGLPNNGSGFYNYTLAGHQYLAQMEWDQRVLNCSTTNRDVQPVVTISPTTAVQAHATTFTAHVTERGVTVAVNRVVWSFGDRTSATTSTNTVSHTYATAGSKALTAIVTDTRGNEKKVAQTITVS
jgi:hypothetical protein